MIKGGIFLAAGALLLLAGVFFACLKFPTQPASSSLARNLSQDSRESIARVGGPHRGAGGTASAHNREAEEMRQSMLEAESRLLKAPSPLEVGEILSELAARLDTKRPAEAALAIEEYLRTGRDVPTRLGFVVSPDGGTLEEVPTLRSWLLDLLGCIDPVAAASQARTLLTQRRFQNGGESALAMRNLVWGSGQTMAGVDRQIFESATIQHLSNGEWAANPDQGYLEGFDAAVFSPSRLAVSRLAVIASDGGGPAASRFAARLALERMALDAGGDPLAAIGDSALDAVAKGEILALANPEDPEVVRVLERFLQDANRSEAQAAFFSGFPQGSRNLGPRLISWGPGEESAFQKDRDRAALELVERWIAEDKFLNYDGALQKIRERLRAFLEY